MNYEMLIQKRDRYQEKRSSIPEYTLQTYEQAFEIEYTHNSTAIEGNSLTLMETKVLVGGWDLHWGKASSGTI